MQKEQTWTITLKPSKTESPVINVSLVDDSKSFLGASSTATTASSLSSDFGFSLSSFFNSGLSKLDEAEEPPNFVELGHFGGSTRVGQVKVGQTGLTGGVITGQVFSFGQVTTGGAAGQVFSFGQVNTGGSAGQVFSFGHVTTGGAGGQVTYPFSKTGQASQTFYLGHVTGAGIAGQVYSAGHVTGAGIAGQVFSAGHVIGAGQTFSAGHVTTGGQVFAFACSKSFSASAFSALHVSNFAIINCLSPDMSFFASTSYDLNSSFLDFNADLSASHWFLVS